MQCSGFRFGAYHLSVMGRTESVLSYDYVDSSYIQMLFTTWDDSSSLIGRVIHSWGLGPLSQKNYLLLTALFANSSQLCFEA